MYSDAAAAAAAASDDRRRLFVRVSERHPPVSMRYLQYLSDISSSQNRVNICFPSFDDACYGGCCGGLLYLHHMRGDAVIFNPISREVKFLPPSNVKRPADTDYSIYDGCGLGFDSQSNDYKVIRFVSNYCVESVMVNGMPESTRCLDSQGEIYSLKTNTWKETSSPKRFLLGCGIYVNNTSKCYWKTGSPFGVISFDFEKESFSSLIPIPPSLPMESDLEGIIADLDLDVFDHVDIFEYRGSLAVIGSKKLGLSKLFEAYILKEQEQEWEKVFAVEVFGDVQRPLGFGKNGQSLFLVGNCVKDKVYQLLEYDLIDRYLKELPFFADRIHRIQILSWSDDDPNANILSCVEGTVVVPGAKQFYFVDDDDMETKKRIYLYPFKIFRSKSMASRQQVMKVYSTAAAAVDDHRQLFVQLSLRNSSGYGCGYGNQYLCDISSAKNKENIYLPSFNSESYSGCCGGLLYLHHMEGKTVIVNPIRREFKFLPPSDVQRPPRTDLSIYHSCGLGFDSQSNDYKFIRSVSNFGKISHHDDGSLWSLKLPCQAEIYSLKTNSWKEISAPEVLSESCGIYFNTKCYWVSYSSSSPSVISFDFEKESYSSFGPMPSSLTTYDLDIFEYMGSLAVIGYKKLGFYTLFEAYVVKEEEHVMWEKLFAAKVFGDHRPLGFVKNGLSLFLEGKIENKDYQLLVFDLIDRYWEELPIFGKWSRGMQIIYCSYDDPDVDIFSDVESIVVLPGTKQFFVEEGPATKQFLVKEVLEIENQFFVEEVLDPRNHHPYRNFGQQVSVGSTEQGQGLNKRRAAVGSSWMTKTESLKVFIALGGKSDYGCEARYVLTSEDGRARNRFKLATGCGDCPINCVYQEEQHSIPAKNKGKKMKSATGCGDCPINCVYQEEQHSIQAKNKGKKMKSATGCGDCPINCVYQEEQHSILAKTKGKKMKSEMELNRGKKMKSDMELKKFVVY